MNTYLSECLSPLPSVPDLLAQSADIASREREGEGVNQPPSVSLSRYQALEKALRAQEVRYRALESETTLFTEDTAKKDLATATRSDQSEALQKRLRGMITDLQEHAKEARENASQRQREMETAHSRTEQRLESRVNQLEAALSYERGRAGTHTEHGCSKERESELTAANAALQAELDKLRLSFDAQLAAGNEYRGHSQAVAMDLHNEIYRLKARIVDLEEKEETVSQEAKLRAIRANGEAYRQTVAREEEEACILSKTEYNALAAKVVQGLETIKLFQAHQASGRLTFEHQRQWKELHTQILADQQRIKRSRQAEQRVQKQMQAESELKRRKEASRELVMDRKRALIQLQVEKKERCEDKMKWLGERADLLRERVPETPADVVAAIIRRAQVDLETVAEARAKDQKENVWLLQSKQSRIDQLEADLATAKRMSAEARSSHSAALKASKKTIASLKETLALERAAHVRGTFGKSMEALFASEDTQKQAEKALSEERVRRDNESSEHEAQIAKLRDTVRTAQAEAAEERVRRANASREHAAQIAKLRVSISTERAQAIEEANSQAKTDLVSVRGALTKLKFEQTAARLAERTRERERERERTVAERALTDAQSRVAECEKERKRLAEELLATRRREGTLAHRLKVFTGVTPVVHPDSTASSIAVQSSLVQEPPQKRPMPPVPNPLSPSTVPHPQSGSPSVVNKYTPQTQGLYSRGAVLPASPTASLYKPGPSPVSARAQSVQGVLSSASVPHPLSKGSALYMGSPVSKAVPTTAESKPGVSKVEPTVTGSGDVARPGLYTGLPKAKAEAKADPVVPGASDGVRQASLYTAKEATVVVSEDQVKGEQQPKLSLYTPQAAQPVGGTSTLQLATDSIQLETVLKEEEGERGQTQERGGPSLYAQGHK
ncbi:hypothetical protein KIPB_006363 [Kipferlia bialata]|uniref:Uncharacterized protein n=1 Tax=Kipferlia bialata TaxID=797122 RepID=A0A9K3CYI7_9EUKA|nr:hypothetical protein KIPB_006363 [Kipferlia bialata]|eukprot:g6363.t1